MRNISLTPLTLGSHLTVNSFLDALHRVTPALWSAVAATASAVSAFLTFRLNRANRLDAARPELVLSEWSRDTLFAGSPAEHDVIRFKTIKNVGKGPAFHLWLHCFEVANNFPLALLSSIRLPLLAPGEEQVVDGAITVYWRNLHHRTDYPLLLMRVTIFGHDSIGLIYETDYHLAASPGGMAMLGGTTELADGVSMSHRSTHYASARRRRLEGKMRATLQRIPLVRRLNWPRSWPDVG